MAKKPAKAAAVEDLPPAMDYAQHNATYEGFMQLLKWGIIAVALIVVALYCFIELHSPLVGWLLILLIPVGAVGLAVTGTTRRS